MDTLTKLAWRSIWRNKRRTIITFISIAFGLALAIFFISMANGGYNQIIEDAVRMQAGHITIEHRDYRDAPAVDLYVADPGAFKSQLESLENVENTKSLISGNGVAKSGNGAIGVGFLGVEPSKEIHTSPIAEKIIEGQFLEDGDERKVLIGATLAKRLQLKLGSKMVISTNDVDGNLIEELCRVKGIFKTGSVETDTYFVIVPIDFARKLISLPEGAVTQFGVILKNPYKLRQSQREVSTIVKDEQLSVLTWRQVMPDVAAFIELDSKSGYIFYSIIIVLVLFTIFNTILMSVIERKHEFAIMLAIGTSPRMLESQVVMESIFLGFMGVLMGAILGTGVSYYYQVHGIDFSSMYGEESSMSISGATMEMVVHNKLTPLIVYGCSLIVFLSTIVLSFLPMRRASRVNFSDILR